MSLLSTLRHRYPPRLIAQKPVDVGLTICMLAMGAMFVFAPREPWPIVVPLAIGIGCIVFGYVAGRCPRCGKSPLLKTGQAFAMPGWDAESICSRCGTDLNAIPSSVQHDEAQRLG